MKGMGMALLAAGWLATAALAAQPPHHHSMSMPRPARAAGVGLRVQDDATAHILTVTLGPLALPAHSSHMAVAQPPEVFFNVPFEGWLKAYHPRLIDEAGNAEPGRLLHHVAFWNTKRPDFLCPNKQEHIFGAGGEMTDWNAVPGVGYRVHRENLIRISSMFHNPTAVSYPKTYLEVKVEYQPANAGVQLANVYPTWIDVEQCGESDYDLQPGRSVSSGKFTLSFSGKLLGVGGHMHDYGRQLELSRLTRHEIIATLDSRLDGEGHLLSMPVVYFTEQGGYHLDKGDEVEVKATYENPSGHPLPRGAMGIIVGYFLPDNDSELAGLKR